MELATATRRRRGAHWTSNPHQQLPDDLAEALRSLRGQRGQLGAALAACRAAEWGVPALSVALGMKPAAVAQQIRRARLAGPTIDLPTLRIPAPPLPAIQYRLAGPALPTAVAAHLRDVHAVARRNRGYMPADDPCRIAAEHLAFDIDHLLHAGHPKARICDALGVTYRAVDQCLERHGLREPVPSAPEHIHRYRLNAPGRYRR